MLSLTALILLLGDRIGIDQQVMSNCTLLVFSELSCLLFFVAIISIFIVVIMSIITVFYLISIIKPSLSQPVGFTFF